jgi:hypothetical protein
MGQPSSLHLVGPHHTHTNKIYLSLWERREEVVQHLLAEGWAHLCSQDRVGSSTIMCTGVEGTAYPMNNVSAAEKCQTHDTFLINDPLYTGLYSPSFPRVRAVIRVKFVNPEAKFMVPDWGI